ncbi:Glycerophosphoryl diester phosphodiesterase [Butyrivibrio sp. ob235]|uniref:hypothetical protein n=1 Tax=Butyrivibrio sp. ob235 TaxID=1761780 RepID=UPI0008B6A895|nr:hypothetical protein [Butyrivibrio sp. ob235]SEM26787.1 Glycerophosphoryl diester phosphodiesterase [Butyrivibrio sp. ob235]
MCFLRMNNRIRAFVLALNLSISFCGVYGCSSRQAETGAADNNGINTEAATDDNTGEASDSENGEDATSAEEADNTEQIAVIGYHGYPTLEEDGLNSLLAAKDLGDDYVWIGVQDGKLESLQDSIKLVKGELEGYESIRSTARPELKVCIEFEDTETDEELLTKVINLVSEEGMSDRVIYASAQYDSLQSIKDMNSNSQILYIVSTWTKDVISECPADYYGISSDFVSQDILDQIHNSGSKVFALEADTLASIRDAIAIGVDGVVTGDSGIAIVAVNTRFDEFLSNLESTVTLPWLYSDDETDDDFVVQGFTDTGDVLVVSAYDKKGEKTSIVYLFTREGELLHRVDMQTMAHAGGLAFDERNDLLWITGENGHVLAAPWKEVLDGSFAGDYVTDFDGELVNHGGSHVASFIGMYDGDLYVGSYCIGQSGKLRKYDVSDSSNPVMVKEVDIPDCIQGVTFYRDDEDKEFMILSQSHEVDDAHLLTFEYGEDIDSYDEPLRSELMPEGSENLQMTDEGLYILFESGSKPYRETARVPNDKLYLMKR